MIEFIDTQAGKDWISTFASRDTDFVVMYAIALVSIDEEQAEMIWQYGPENETQASAILASATGNGDIDARLICWGESDLAAACGIIGE